MIHPQLICVRISRRYVATRRFSEHATSQPAPLYSNSSSTHGMIAHAQWLGIMYVILVTNFFYSNSISVLLGYRTLYSTPLYVSTLVSLCPRPNKILCPSVINLPAPKRVQHCVASSVVDTEAPSSLRAVTAYSLASCHQDSLPPGLRNVLYGHSTGTEQDHA